VLAREPDLAALPPTLHPRLIEVVTRSLEKRPRQRWQAIGDVRAELEAIAAHPQAVSKPAAVVQTSSPFWTRAAAVAFFVGAALTLGAMLGLRRTAPPAVARFSYALPPGQALAPGSRPNVAISPDGSQFAYTASGRLYLRTLATFDSTPVPGAEIGALILSGEPTFSPDGKWIAFYHVVDRSVKRIATTGGAAVTICSTTQAPYGMSWSGDTIFFADPRGILRVPATGGVPTLVAAANPGGEILSSPHAFPDGRFVLFTRGIGTEDKAEIVAQSLTSSERKILLTGGSNAQYLATGHLVYVLGGVLFAVPFDLGHMAVTGGPVPVVEGVARAPGTGSGPAHFSLSTGGALVYIPGPAIPAAGGERDLVLVDRSGGVERVKVPSGSYAHPRISPDGKRLAFGVDDGKDASIWIYDFAGTTAMRRLTFGSKDHYPVWSRDGQRITFQSDREGDLGIFSVGAEGGTPERLTKAQPGEAHIPDSWTPSDERLLFDVAKGSMVTLWTLARQGRSITQIVGVQSTMPTSAQFSPDGHWMAYATSTISGTGDVVFVQPFPPTGQKYQVSQGELDAHHPLWSPDGRELTYIPQPGRFIAVSLSLHPFGVGNPIQLPRRFTVENGPTNVRSHDVTPDGKRFIGVVVSSDTLAETTPNAEIRVVLNWFEELKARVPSK
jgi:serine/threonine-protein kinase